MIIVNNILLSAFAKGKTVIVSVGIMLNLKNNKNILKLVKRIKTNIHICMYVKQHIRYQYIEYILIIQFAH